MKSFEGGFLDRFPVGHRMLRLVARLAEYKGKEAVFKEQSPQALETLRQTAIIQSTESSNRIEGVTAPLKRIQALVREKTTPKNRPEREIAGYRDVLNTIHGSHEHIPFTTGVVLQFHRDLFTYTESPGGTWKAADNAIEEVHPDGTRIVRFRPVSAVLTPDYMEKLHELFESGWHEEKVERLLLIAAYTLDFLCVHPFRDGNGRMARLLTLLLLYRAGNDVGRYISLEKIIEESKETYYEALGLSSQGWHDGKHDLLPWADYLLGVLVAAYRKFEERVGVLAAARGSKTEMVLRAIEQMRGDFSVSELQAKCPGVGLDLIRRILGRERQAGRLESPGRGPAARWKKVPI
jgi:Fic family protein